MDMPHPAQRLRKRFLYILTNGMDKKSRLGVSAQQTVEVLDVAEELGRKPAIVVVRFALKVMEYLLYVEECGRQNIL